MLVANTIITKIASLMQVSVTLHHNRRVPHNRQNKILFIKKNCATKTSWCKK